MRVLVTGAKGFAGRHLLEALAQASIAAAPHDIEDGDLARTPPRQEGVTHVVHLAARSSVAESWRQPASFYETNVLGTVNVLEFCRRTGAGLILVSSYVYGRPRSLPVSEDHPLEAFNPYGHSKILAEEAARYYAQAFGLRAAIVRPFNLYGPGQAGSFLIPALLRQILNPGKDTVEVMDARPRRDFLYVGDFTRLLVLMLQAGAEGVFNAGSGQSTGIGELVDLMNELAGTRKRLVDRQQPRPEEVFDLYADIGRARQAFGWEPRTGLRAGLAETIRRWRAA